MRHFALVCLLAVPVFADEKAKPNTLTPKEIEDGWILLFDGETTFGWKVDGEAKGFGSSDLPVLVRSPLLVQSSWPRFAAPGDRFVALADPAFRAGVPHAAARMRRHPRMT